MNKPRQAHHHRTLRARLRNLLQVGFTTGMLLLGNTLAHSQALAILEEMVPTRNPQLKMLDLRYQAMLEKSGQVAQLPDPVVAAGIPLFRPETRLGGQVFTLGVSQMFPWKGTLQTREAVSLLEARAQYEQIDARRINLLHDLRTSYYSLQLIEEKQRLLSTYTDQYDQLRKITLARVEAGKAGLADVLQLDLKIEEVEYEIRQLENKKAPYYARINEALNRPVNVTIQVKPLPDQPADLPFAQDTNVANQLTRHPLLQQLDWQIATSRKKQELNQLARKPSFGVGLEYSWVNPRTDADPQFNGRDILIPKATVTLPIDQRKYRSIDQEEVLKQMAASEEKVQITNQLERLLVEYKSQYQDDLITLNYIDDQTRTIRRTYQLLLTAYSNDSGSFTDLIEIQNKLLAFEMRKAEVLLDTYIQASAVLSLIQYP